MNQQGFAEIEHALTMSDAVVPVSEAHGCLCGALCTLAQFSSLHWLRELLPDPADGELLPESTAIDSVLEHLHDDTLTALRGADMSFAPLLPDDEAPIGQRIEALAQWAQGFLYGFGIGAQSAAMAPLPDQVKEVLKDLSEIARANETDSGGSEEEEDAYAELVEYLRAAVQLVHDELVEQRSAQTKIVAH